MLCLVNGTLVCGGHKSCETSNVGRFLLPSTGNKYQKIAETVSCSVAMVFDTLNWHEETGSTKSKPHCGRPPLLNANQCKHLKRYGEETSPVIRFRSTRIVRGKKTNHDVSHTYPDIFHSPSPYRASSPLFHWTAKLCSPEKTAHIASEQSCTSCLALEHETWTEEEWGKVLSSDESRVEPEEWSASCLRPIVPLWSRYTPVS